MNELENKLLTEVYSKYYIGEHGECRYFDECKKRLKKKKIKHQCDSEPPQVVQTAQKSGSMVE